MKTLRIWYYAGFKNFGDRLSTYILNHYGRTHNVKFVYTPNKSQADIIGMDLFYTLCLLTSGARCGPLEVFNTLTKRGTWERYGGFEEN